MRKEEKAATTRTGVADFFVPGSFLHGNVGFMQLPSRLRSYGLGCHALPAHLHASCIVKLLACDLHTSFPIKKVHSIVDEEPRRCLSCIRCYPQRRTVVGMTSFLAGELVGPGLSGTQVLLGACGQHFVRRLGPKERVPSASAKDAFLLIRPPWFWLSQAISHSERAYLHSQKALLHFLKCHPTFRKCLLHCH